MLARLFGLLTVFTLVVVPNPARSADAEKAGTPTVIIRLDSINNLIEDVKYVGGMSSQKDKIEEGLGFLKAQVDQLSIDKAIDFNRPLGMYVFVDPQNPVDSTGAILLPVIDEKKVLELVEMSGQSPQKGEDEVYSLGLPFGGDSLYFRFANKYVYVTFKNKSSVAKESLLDPSKVFGSGKFGTFSADFRFDQIPAGIREMGLTIFEAGVADEKNKKIPGETPAQTKIRHQVIDETTKQVATIVKEGGDVAISFNVDRQAGELKGESSFRGKPGSKLAARIADLTKANSVFAGLGASGSAFRFLAHCSVPDDMRQALEPLVDEAIKDALEHEKDATKRDQEEKLARAFEPTIKAGELDVFLNLSGPDKDKHYTPLMGIKIKEGKKIETALRDLVRIVPERDRDRIKLDAEKAGGVNIHRVDIQEKYDSKFRNVVGDNPVYVAVRQDAFLIAVGPEALTSIKQAIKAEPKTAPEMELTLSMARLAPLIDSHIAEHLGHKGAADVAEKASREAFDGENKNKDKIQISVVGGESLKGTFAMSARIVKFLGYIRTHAEGGAAQEFGGARKIQEKKKIKDAQKKPEGAIKKSDDSEDK